MEWNGKVRKSFTNDRQQQRQWDFIPKSNGMEASEYKMKYKKPKQLRVESCNRVEYLDQFMTSSIYLVYLSFPSYTYSTPKKKYVRLS